MERSRQAIAPWRMISVRPAASIDLMAASVVPLGEVTLRRSSVASSEDWSRRVAEPRTV